MKKVLIKLLEHNVLQHSMKNEVMRNIKKIYKDLVHFFVVWTQGILALFNFLQHLLVESKVVVFTFYQWLHQKP